MTQDQRGVSLIQVYASNTETDNDGIDIIAIHGLDTKSPDTWIWKFEDPNRPYVNWLADQDMLPSRVGSARIFTCDSPAEMFRPSDSSAMEMKEFARLLLAGIQHRYSAIDAPITTRSRSIVFIASCLGGIILMQALVMAAPDYLSIKENSRGIIFLATPFRGTSFQDIANWAEPGLRLWASLGDKQVTKLLDSLKGQTFDLGELVHEFTQLCLDCSYQVRTFYESHDTQLHTKIPLANWSPHWLLDRSIPPKQLVDKASASLDIVRHPLRLDRPHVTMNKFSGPDDLDYKIVTGTIEGMLRDVRNRSPLAIADTFIRAKHYTPERLQIIRLSGESLRMSQCYINLAILQTKHTGSDESDSPSKLSLFDRLRTNTPYKDAQVDLKTIFMSRQLSEGRQIQPRRILIRGRAGVGKTTLCKKMVHDFTYKGMWNELFDHLFWVPLRNLKRRSFKDYNLRNLLYHEYFSQRSDGESLAKEVWAALEASKFERALFVLDGLDEISEGLVDDHEMNAFLKSLLDLPNVVLTSRPYLKLPESLTRLDLQVETVGFYPDQVNEYLEATIEKQNQVGKMRSFLEKHWLLRGLVRIPIQLDAFCYTWEDFDLEEDAPHTMTGIYVAIERKLWKKDIVRLGIRAQDKIHDARSDSEINPLITPEQRLLEALAFSGLYNDTMNFDWKYRDKFYARSGRPSTDLSSDATLERLSFLRTSDSSSSGRNRSYHFLHLTFQEYFAARYFVRKWIAQEQLECMDLEKRSIVNTNLASFIQKYKYTGHYNVFWRFVTGLLDARDLAPSFFDMIDSEPRDLLGLEHQRLAMHCLAEVSSGMPMRPWLEENIADISLLGLGYIVAEVRFSDLSLGLMEEVEFPDSALIILLQQGSLDIKKVIFRAFPNRTRTSPAILELAVAHLRSDDDGVRSAAGYFLRRQSKLPNGILNSITALYKHGSPEIKQVAITALERKSVLPNSIIEDLKLLLEDDYLRPDVLKVLAHQSSVSNDARQAIIEQIGSDRNSDDLTTVDALEDISSSTFKLHDDILQALKRQLAHGTAPVRLATLQVLQYQSSLPYDIIDVLKAQLDDKNIDLRLAAIETSWYHQYLSVDGVVNLTTKLLGDTSPLVRQETASALLQFGGASLPSEILEALVILLWNDSTRYYAMYIFHRQTTLPSEIISAIMTLFMDESAVIRKTAIITLRYQLLFSDEVLNAVINCLKDGDCRVRAAAVHVLGTSEILTASIENDIPNMTCIDSNDATIKEPDTILPERHEKLTLFDIGNVLNTALELLKDEDHGIRSTAVETLGALPLSDDIVKATTAAMKDTHWFVRSAASEALAKQPRWSIETFKIVKAMLKDNDAEIKKVALRALEGQPASPIWVLQAITPMLNFPSKEIRWKAEAILRRHSDFYATLLNSSHGVTLYGILLHRSFEEPVTMYFKDGGICINTSEGSTRCPIHDEQRFMQIVMGEKKRLMTAAKDTWTIGDNNNSISESCSHAGGDDIPQFDQDRGCFGALLTTLQQIFFRASGQEERTAGSITEPLLAASR